jgi:hypothetical protein
MTANWPSPARTASKSCRRRVAEQVHLRAPAEGLGADAAHGEGAADRQVDVVVEDRRREPQGEGLPQQIAPEQAGVHQGVAGVDLAHGREDGHVDHHPGRHLGLAEGAVPLAAGGDLDVVAAGEVDQTGDVLDRARLQHGSWPAVDGMAEIVGGGGQAGIVDEELTVEMGESIRRPRTAGRQLRRRGPAPQLGIETGDGHRRQRASQEVPAGDRRVLRFLMIRMFRHDKSSRLASIVKKLSRG